MLVPPLVMMNSPRIQHDNAVLRYKLSLICVILSRQMRRSEPQRIIHALYLFDDRAHIG
jgi:hypothetical protein